MESTRASQLVPCTHRQMYALLRRAVPNWYMPVTTYLQLRSRYRQLYMLISTNKDRIPRSTATQLYKLQIYWKIPVTNASHSHFKFLIYISIRYLETLPVDLHYNRKLCEWIVVQIYMILQTTSQQSNSTTLQTLILDLDLEIYNIAQSYMDLYMQQLGFLPLHVLDLQML